MGKRGGPSLHQTIMREAAACGRMKPKAPMTSPLESETLAGKSERTLLDDLRSINKLTNETSAWVAGRITAAADRIEALEAALRAARNALEDAYDNGDDWTKTTAAADAIRKVLGEAP